MRRAPRIRRSCRRRCAWRWAGRSCRRSRACRDELPVITLENDLEQLLQGSLAGAGGAQPGPGARPRRTPAAATLADTSRRQEMLGEPAVLLVPPSLRQTLARFVRAGVPGLQVLAWNEIPDNRRVRLVTAVGK